VLLPGLHDRAQYHPFLRVDAFNKDPSDFRGYFCCRAIDGLALEIGLQIQDLAEVYECPAIVSEKEADFSDRTRLVLESEEYVPEI